MGSQRVVPAERIERIVLQLRGQRVILDADLALVYGTSTKALNQAIKRNAERFPSDFAFRLTPEEKDEVVTTCDHLARLKFSPVLPLAFTEHGVIMAASVLSSPRAVEMSIVVVRAFVRLRTLLASQRQLAGKVAELERQLATHDEHIQALFATIRELMEAPDAPVRRIGFTAS